MPNIEIHGCADPETMVGPIFDLFRGKEYADDMVVTIYPTKVVDKNGKAQPFLRLVNSCQNHSDEIIEKLRTLHIDIEHLVLQKFVSKSELLCDDYRFLLIAGPNREDMPSSVQKMMEAHEATCKLHDDSTSHQSDLGVPVSREMEQRALGLVQQLAA